MERLAGRYELATQVTRGKGRALWQGRDSVLDRPVGVLVLDPDHPQAATVRAAATASARVEHPGLMRVIDADVDQGRVFVVTPWWPGVTLAERLAATGPLPAAEAATVVRHVADALASSAAAGVHHLVLDPRDVVLTDHGAVLVGVGVRAALEHVEPAGDADRVDAWRLGALLYAALTARWPGEACAGLPPAPMVDGRVARPQQVRAGVPRPLDDVARRCLDPDDDRPLTTPQAVAEALEEAEHAVDPAGRGAALAGSSVASWPWARMGLAAIAAIVVTALALIAVQVWQDAGRPDVTDSPTPTPTSASPSSPPPTATEELTAVPLAGVRAFDPAGDRTENEADAELAVDGDSTTAWRTVTYTTRDLGGLKPGVGLLLDLGTLTDVSGVDLELVGRGTDLQVLVSERTKVRATAAAPTRGFTRLASVRGAGDQVTLRSAQPTPARWVLVWLTALPVDTDGYRGGVAEVAVLQ